MRQALPRCVFVVALCAVLCGCTPRFQSSGQIPAPGASTPYGYVVVDIELGDTRGAELKLTSPGFVDRVQKIRADGVLVMKMNRGPWTLRISGTASAPSAVTFGNEGGPRRSGGVKQWPQYPLRIDVKRGWLTNAGTICAHSACKETWAAFDDEAMDGWRGRGRYLEAMPPSPEGEEESDKKTEEKPPALEADP